MKKYIKPEIEVIKLETESPLATSGDFGGSGSDMPWAPSEDSQGTGSDMPFAPSKSNDVGWGSYSRSNFGPEVFEK